LKIAHVVDSLEIGGAEMMVASLCRLHRASGHSLSVHCLFRGGLLAERLEQEGFAVLEADEGELVLTLVKRERPALVILDLMLPGMSGLDLQNDLADTTHGVFALHSRMTIAN